MGLYLIQEAREFIPTREFFGNHPFNKYNKLGRLLQNLRQAFQDVSFGLFQLLSCQRLSVH